MTDEHVSPLLGLAVGGEATGRAREKLDRLLHDRVHLAGRDIVDVVQPPGRL